MTKGLHKNSLRKVDNPHQWMIDDARMELIQQIKAEIERLKTDVDNSPLATEQIAGYLFALVDVQKFLNTLQEQPVKPSVEDAMKELDKKIAKATKSWKGVDVDKMLAECRGYDEQPVCKGLEEYASKIVTELVPTLGQKYPDGSYVGGTRDYFSREELIGLVKAGAKWKMEQSELSCEGLEEAAIQAHIRLEESEELSFLNIFKAGAEWQKEKLMRFAVEGYLVTDGLNDLQVKTANLGDRGYYQGDKVRIIIVKEEENGQSD